MSVPTIGSDSISFGQPVVLFTLPQNRDQVFSYDVAPDGQRFLMTVPGGVSDGEPGVRLVLDWTAGLPR